MKEKKINKSIILILITIIILLAIFVTIFLFQLSNKSLLNSLQKEKSYTFEKETASIDEIYIYGTHLNMNGSLTTTDNVKNFTIALINNNEEIIVDTNYSIENNQIKYNLSPKINKGMYLDSYNIGNYTFIAKTTFDITDDKGETQEKTKYYLLKNNTEYEETTYYTIRKNNRNNKIVFTNNGPKYSSLTMDITENKDEEIYDIAVDAGHGGKDPGACYHGKCETDYTLSLAKKLKEKLEKEGLKVKLTRETNEGSFPTYGEDGRVVIPQKAHAKYLFSFHLNAGSYDWGGVEIYCPFNSDNTLASDIATYITSYAETNFSNKIPYRVGNGIYIRTFKQNEIDSFNEEIDRDGYARYNINYETNYYYIIRETGGYMTGAYTDGRDGKLVNPFVKSNVGIESYIMEVGYISNQNDLNNIDQKQDKYVEAIKEATIHNIYK